MFYPAVYLKSLLSLALGEIFTFQCFLSVSLELLVLLLFIICTPPPLAFSLVYSLFTIHYYMSILTSGIDLGFSFSRRLPFCLAFLYCKICDYLEFDLCLYRLFFCLDLLKLSFLVHCASGSTITFPPLTNLNNSIYGPGCMCVALMRVIGTVPLHRGQQVPGSVT